MKNDNFSKGVKITVATKYDRVVRLKDDIQFIFAYKIRIQNLTDRKIQLISRKWTILNGMGDKKIVKGQGVIGKQPILAPEDVFQYASWCPLNTELGKMFGYYNFLDIETTKTFKVNTPEFLFQTDFVNS